MAVVTVNWENFNPEVYVNVRLSGDYWDDELRKPGLKGPDPAEWGTEAREARGAVSQKPVPAGVIPVVDVDYPDRPRDLDLVPWLIAGIVVMLLITLLFT
jgi:hypothetical protein